MKQYEVLGTPLGVYVVGVIKDGVTVYADPYMDDDNTLLKGHKSQEIGDVRPVRIFIIATPKTANMLYEQYKTSMRRKKLERICDGTL